MKNLKFILAILLIFNSYALLGQKTIKFLYDENGNRKTRSLKVQQVQTNSVSFPVNNPEALTPKFIESGTKGSNSQTSENLKSTESGEIQADDSQIQIKIFPNPTKGLLRIETLNMPHLSRNELRLYDLNGTELIFQKNFEGISDLNISHLKNGIYILRIKINENLFDFKVIKND